MSDNIPPELVTKILLMLPIADMLRSTSVCKSWYQLITSFSFISMHLNSAIFNPQSRVILGCTTKNDRFKRHYYLHRDNQTFDEILELKPPRNHDTLINIHGSSNGVLCYSADRRFIKVDKERLMLWNPCLRKSLVLPKSKYAHLLNHQQHSVGFGFLPSTNTYKVVRVIHTLNSDNKFIVPPEVEVYDSYTRSWHDIYPSEFSYILDFNGDQVLLNGIVHWTACDEHRVEGSCTYGGVIVSFDLITEKFGALMLPKCLQNEDSPVYSVMSTEEGSLCLIHAADQCCIFIMKEYGVTESWEKLFILDSTNVWPLKIRENGEILGIERIDADDEEGSDKYRLMSCDLKTNEIIDLGVREDTEFYSIAYACVDSLFLI